jgi:hypothetical protein
MRCPHCEAPDFDPRLACPRCGFRAAPYLLEELSHLTWALEEIDAWLARDVTDLAEVQTAYAARRRALEVELGLRPPPLTAAQARAALLELHRQTRCLERLSLWQQEGRVDARVVQPRVDALEARIAALRERLDRAPDVDFSVPALLRLDVAHDLLAQARRLREAGAFVSDEAYAAAVAALEAEQATLEDRLGLAPPPPSGQAPAPPARVTPPSEPPAAPAAPPRPRLPLRQRLARTLLSERTLHAILFLGIFLLFSAAITFVIWGWKDFSPAMRVVIPPVFTLAFFLMGGYLRARTSLVQSGVALIAIAALLIPVDFYTAYVTLDLMPGRWAEFWLLTSLICLGAYLGVAWGLRNLFFGYLVTTAAGSVVLAAVEVGHQAGTLSRDWYAGALAVLSLGLMLVAAALAARRRRLPRWRFYVPALRTFALLTVGVLMPLALGWRVVDRETYDALHHSATVTWWLGGLLLGWGAVIYRSRTLGLISVIALPVAASLTQAALFDALAVNAAWHALGWAALVPLYVVVGWRLVAREDEGLGGHGRTVNWVSLLLILVAALWALTDLSRGAAAAASHAVLVGGVVLAAALWRRPAYLYGASALALSAVTFALSELSLTLAQSSVGWVSLALLHVLVALALGRRRAPEAPNFAAPLVHGGYAIGALAVLLTLFPFDFTLGRPQDPGLALYALGHWIALAGWGAHLAHTGRRGFASPRPWMRRRFHIWAALPLPLWLWFAFTWRRPADVSLALALAALAWGMVALAYRLRRADPAYRWPWYLTGWITAVAAVVVALGVDLPGLGPALTLLSAGALAFADAVTLRRGVELAPAGLLTAAGLLVLLDRLHVTFDAATLGLSGLIAAYVLAGLATERRRRVAFPRAFLAPLYLTAHALTLFVLARVYVRPLVALAEFRAWTDTMKLWGAAAQLTLGVLYGLYAWGTYKERWGHVAAWLGTAAGGFLFIVYSQGRGSSAAKAAAMVVVFVLAERVLHALKGRPRLPRRIRAFFRLAWHLYRRPFLVTGWVLSAGTIGLALVRNLWLLGGGRTRQWWAVAGLLIITALYALSARLFRRPLFVWLAAGLLFAPWTILTDLGWLTPYRLTTAGFAASWAVLAWALTLSGLVVGRRAPRPYAQPLRVVAHLWMPFALAWGVVDAETSRVTFGLAVAFYALHAGLDHRRLRAAVRSVARTSLWLYPALGLIPVWCVYLLAEALPGARPELHGLMLLTFGPLGLAGGALLRRLVPAAAREAAGRYALPAYLTGYGALGVGTVLVAHRPGLLTLVLLFDALLMLVSARVLRQPLWDYGAAVLAPGALLLALGEAGVDVDRYGWWLLGLAAIYFLLAWLLRRVDLPAHASPPLALGFVLVALSLPPSSLDQVGALWGYAGAALLYAVTAFWLGRPLPLAVACGLAVVPYAVALERSALDPAYHGLALLPGAVAALGAGVLLDHRFGAWRDFPWGEPTHWPRALTARALGWWALPLYALGFGLAAAAPLFTAGRADLSALNFLLLVPLCGWALHRFRRRGWLLALALAAHLALVRYLGFLGWWRYPAHAWLRFVPLTGATALAAVGIERRWDEGSPLALRRLLAGWSRPLYLVALLDVMLAQAASLNGTEAAALVTLAHGLLLALLASLWGAPAVAYGALGLGAVALGNELSFLRWSVRRSTVAFAQLSLAYGLLGFGLALARERLRPTAWARIWERPLQVAGLVLSFAALGATAVLGVEVVGWTVCALLRWPFRSLVDLATVRMVVSVLALLGLLYVAAAAAHRRLSLGYVAVGMLLVGWMLHAFYVREWSSAARIQWYAIPAGLYLLGISTLEWQRGHRPLARWLDYAALLLLMGSLFWQTLLYGWNYALMLGAEGLAVLWWGSARRLRRFLYGGMAGVILATLGQLIHSLQSVLQWILVSVVVGLALFLLGAFVERHLGRIRDSLQEALETWE